MTDFVRTPAKVFGLCFVTPEDAAWMAVRALILSCSSGSDFQTLYLGLLSLKSGDADETRGGRGNLDQLLRWIACRK